MSVASVGGGRDVDAASPLVGGSGQVGCCGGRKVEEGSGGRRSSGSAEVGPCRANALRCGAVMCCLVLIGLYVLFWYYTKDLERTGDEDPMDYVYEI